MYKTAGGLNHTSIHGYQVLFPQQRCEADYSPPPTAKVNKTWSYTCISPYAIMIWHLSMGTMLPVPRIISTTKYNLQQFFYIWYLTILPAYLVSPSLMSLGISHTTKLWWQSHIKHPGRKIRCKTWDLRFSQRCHWGCKSLTFFFDVHVTVHRDKFLIINQPDALISQIYFGRPTCFGQFLCPSSGDFHCTHSNGICHTGFSDIYHCCVYSEYLLTMDRGTVRNITSGWFIIRNKKKMQVFQDVTMCHWMSGSWYFEGMKCLQNTGNHSPSSTALHPTHLNLQSVKYWSNTESCIWQRI